MSDFNKNETNTAQDTRSFGGGSGLKAGVEAGLSSVESLKRGSVDSLQQTSGDNFVRTQEDQAAGSKNGKNFSFRA